MNNKKILILSDLKNATNSTLKSAVSLAKMSNATIDFFHVRKPVDVVTQENQLSANRSFVWHYKSTNKKIKEIIIPFSEKYGVTINYKFSFGNVKNEIDAHIKECNPDIIILGKRKSTIFNIAGSNVTDFILKKHKKSVILVEHDNSLEPDKQISIGLLNDFKQEKDESFSSTIVKQAQEPIATFKITKSNNTAKANSRLTTKKTIEYVFERNDNTVKKLSDYLLKNNINLLCMQNGKKDKESLTKTDFNNVMNKLNVSLLVTHT